MTPYEEKLQKAQAAYASQVKKELNKYLAKVEGIVYGAQLKGSATQSIWTVNPGFEKQIDESLRVMGDEVVSKIQQGTYVGWNLADQANDALVLKYTRGMDIPPTIAAAMLGRNGEALETFLKRKVDGMNLSDRVWALTAKTKTQLEIALAEGIAAGLPARQLASQTKQYLKYPDKLFRRVRNKETGKLELSKAAKAFHPGRGVYRSSFQNALRLTGTEINMAYRESDYQRRQSIPFVTGVRINLSAAHPRKDICDYMAGEYPKGFRFPGWHPRCICWTENILLKEDQFIASLKAGYVKENKYIKDIPRQAQVYLNAKLGKIQGMAKKPYWFNQNFDAMGQASKLINPVAVSLINYGSASLNIPKPIPMAKGQYANLAEELAAKQKAAQAQVLAEQKAAQAAADLKKAQAEYAAGKKASEDALAKWMANEEKKKAEYQAEKLAWEQQVKKELAAEKKAKAAAKKAEKLKKAQEQQAYIDKMGTVGLNEKLAAAKLKVEQATGMNFDHMVQAGGWPVSTNFDEAFTLSEWWSYKMTADMKSAFTYYTGSGYTNLNTYLRTGGAGMNRLTAEQMGDYANLIRAGLATGPKYQGQLYRGFKTTRESMEGRYLKAWGETGVHIDSGFMSSSFKKEVADSFARANSSQPVSVNLYIRNSHSSTCVKPVGLKHEDEFLFADGTEFRVVSITKRTVRPDYYDIDIYDVILEEL